MIIPWKVNFLLQQLTWSTYKKTNDVMLSPLTYYGSLVDLARNKRITAPWTFNLKTGSTVNTFAGNRIETVAMVSILDVLEEHLIFDLVKIDCEGAEYQILMTLEPKHTGQVPKIIFETINEGAKTRNLFAHLTSIGYTIRPSHNLFIAEVAGHSKRLEHIHVHSTAS